MKKKRMCISLLSCAVLSISLPVVSQQNNTAGRGTAQDFNTTRSNRDNRLAARPGGPIGGIIVKGGKNPGGQMLTMTTDENGEFSLDVTEPGNYVFRISNPPTNEKGIQENGIKRTDAVMLRVIGGGKGVVTGAGGNARVIPGGKGIVVGTGGNARTLQKDEDILIENGEFSLDIPGAGSYKIIITAPKKEHWGDPHENLNGKH